MINSFNEEFTEEEILFIKKIYSQKYNSYSIKENIKLFNKANKDIQNIQKSKIKYLEKINNFKYEKVEEYSMEYMLS